MTLTKFEFIKEVGDKVKLLFISWALITIFFVFINPGELFFSILFAIGGTWIILIYFILSMLRDYLEIVKNAN